MKEMTATEVRVRMREWGCSPAAAALVDIRKANLKKIPCLSG